MTGRDIMVRVADLAVGEAGDRLVTVGLGSCVAIVLHDAVASVGGLAHVLLPSPALTRADTNPAKFPQSAVPRLVSIVESKAPVDAAWVQQEWLYRDALLDVSDIAEEAGKQQGGWYPEIKNRSVWEGKWKSVPFGIIGQTMVYRRDWFEEAGIKKFPETWDEFLEAGTKLKKAGHPFGMSMGHGFADNNSWLMPLLWGLLAALGDQTGAAAAQFLAAAAAGGLGMLQIVLLHLLALQAGPVQVTAQRASASFSRFSQSGVVQMSLAWAETLQGRPRISAA